MHIAEGVLSPTVLGAGAALTLAGTAIGLRRLDTDKVMGAALLSAAFFVASLIHVPVGFTSAHLIGNGLVGIFLGWASFPAILAALLLQALLFQFGGVTVLGVNTFTMAFGAVLAHYVFRSVVRIFHGKKALYAAAFLAGVLGVFFAAILTALALSFSAEGFQAAAVALLLAHLPIMIAEGVITMFTVIFIARVRPDMLDLAEMRGTEDSNR